jgi:rhizosphere induced protein
MTILGTVIGFMGTSDPTPSEGETWLICDGRAINRQDYKDLYSVIGNTYGEGNNTSTFNVPDLRGRFVRGLDGIAKGHSLRDPDVNSRTPMNKGGHAGAKIGSLQAAAAGGTHAHNISDGRIIDGVPEVAAYRPIRKLTPEDRPWGYSADSTGSETRPINAYVSYLIRAK